MADIFDEVDEELRADRARDLLMRYGFTLVLAAGLIVLAVAGWQVWRWNDHRLAVAAAGDYVAAMALVGDKPGEVRDRPGAMAAFAKAAAAGRGGYRSLSDLWQAALAADGGDLDRARRLWDGVAADQGTDPLLRDLASLNWVTHQLDTADPAALAARLKPLLDPANPWHLLAAEADAVLALRRGATEEARTTLRRLTQDATTPEGVRNRASLLLGHLGG